MPERWPTDYEVRMIHAELLFPSARALNAMRREARAADEEPEVGTVALAAQIRRIRGAMDPDSF